MTAFTTQQIKLYEKSEEILNGIPNLDLHLIRSISPNDVHKYLFNKRGPSSPKTAALRWALDHGVNMIRYHHDRFLKSEYIEPPLSLTNYFLTIHPNTYKALNKLAAIYKPNAITDEPDKQRLLDIQASRLFPSRPKYHLSRDFPDRKLRIILMRLAIHEGLLMLDGIRNSQINYNDGQPIYPEAWRLTSLFKAKIVSRVAKIRASKPTTKTPLLILDIWTPEVPLLTFDFWASEGTLLIFNSPAILRILKVRSLHPIITLSTKTPSNPLNS